MLENTPLTFENINEYLADCKSQNACNHTVHNISLDQFRKRGELHDQTCGGLTYTRLKSKTSSHIILSGYPYEACDVYECRRCKQPLLVFENCAGNGICYEYFIVSSNDVFMIDPALNFFSIDTRFAQNVATEFSISELDNPYDIPLSRDAESISEWTINGADDFMAINVNRYVWKDTDEIRFELIAPRRLMRKIRKYTEDLKSEW